MTEFLGLAAGLLLALALGWILGQGFAQARQRRDISAGLNQDYFVGLDHLLNENTDLAIESFIRALEINSETIPAHLALAGLFRRKGDVDRAVHMHQALLARTDLSRADFLRIQMALALDYDALGLLDRAENLLKEIIRQQPGRKMRQQALLTLIRLYEKEAEWQLALQAADQLAQEKPQELTRRLAHYCCQLAEQQVSQPGENGKTVDLLLNRALEYDSHCVRATLIRADRAMQLQQWRVAIKVLRQVPSQDPLFVSETIAPLARCYQALGNQKEFEHYLRQCLRQCPSASVILALAALLHEQQGVYVAGAFLTDELKHRPSVKGFNRLIDMHIEHSRASTADSLKVLRSLTGALETSKPRYLCSQCGYTAKRLVWHCPSCQGWGTLKPIQGLEGE